VCPECKGTGRLAGGLRYEVGVEVGAGVEGGERGWSRGRGRGRGQGVGGGRVEAVADKQVRTIYQGKSSMYILGQG